MFERRCEADPSRRIGELIDLALERNRDQPLDRDESGEKRNGREQIAQDGFHLVATLLVRISRMRLREKIIVAASSTNDIAAAYPKLENRNAVR